jgi:hypothetical protein
MATTLMPLDPATSPQRINRVLTISAHLLPEEIVAARRARRTRAWVLVILAVVVALLAGWYIYAAHEKTKADRNLQRVATEAAILQQSQNKDFADVVTVRTGTEALDKQLRTVMADDLPWATLLNTLDTTATKAGVEVTGISASLSAAGTGAAAPALGTTLPSTTGAATIGTLTLTGTAPDKPAVATFVERLGGLTTVANPYLTSAVDSDTGVQFSLQLDISDTSLCGQFTTACKTGGK